MEHEVSGLAEDLKGLVKRLKAQEKVVAELVAADDAGDGRRLRAALAAVDEEILDRLGLGEAGRAAVERARQRLDALRLEQRRAFVSELEGACEGAGRAFRRLGDSPPELLVAPFTVVVDMESMEAVLRYAREELARVAATAAAIVDAAAREQKALETRQRPPAEVLDQLLVAYRAALAFRGEPVGTRVELAEILPQMALLHQTKRFRADPVRERYSSYPKARFLYDLARLRAARTLETTGLRLDLGTATGDSARSRSRVFFIQGSDARGQCYLSLRFVQR